LAIISGASACVFMTAIVTSEAITSRPTSLNKMAGLIRAGEPRTVKVNVRHEQGKSYSG
jgi:hypothetical protein